MLKIAGFVQASKQFIALRGLTLREIEVLPALYGEISQDPHALTE